MDDLEKLLTNHDQLLALEPPELAMPILKRLAQLRQQAISRSNFLSNFRGHRFGDEIQKALTEAWVWLESEQMLAPDPKVMIGDGMFITRRGQRLLDAGESLSYRNDNLLPKAFLNPVIAHKVWSLFIRGEYDVAVFQAFKEVEVAVRRAGKLTDTDLGTALMRKAFDAKSGPLAAMSDPDAEREAMSHLFAGAIGVNKNPHSHRNVSVDAKQAAERIILASHLLNIVDERIANPSK